MSDCLHNDGAKLVLHEDVGSDIHGAGEERQHIQRCQCGSWRFVRDYIAFEDDAMWERSFGKWQDSDPIFLQQLGL